MFTVERSILIDRRCGDVYRYIREPGRLAALQPFVVAVERAGVAASGPDGPFPYRAVERVPVFEDPSPG